VFWYCRSLGSPMTKIFSSSPMSCSASPLTAKGRDYVTPSSFSPSSLHPSAGTRTFGLAIPEVQVQQSAHQLLEGRKGHHQPLHRPLGISSRWNELVTSSWRHGYPGTPE
jgi:hypothetical protein